MSDSRDSADNVFRRLLLIASLLITGCSLDVVSPVSQKTPTPAPIVDGRWILEKDIPQGQPNAGQYLTVVSLIEVDGKISGTGEWSNGAKSVFTGNIANQTVYLTRVDTNGFRGAFEGTFSVDGHSMTGSGQNDPNSPRGNNARYTWWATRVLPPERSMFVATHCDEVELSWATKYVTQPSWPGHPDPTSAATLYALASFGRCSRTEPLTGETLVDS